MLEQLTKAVRCWRAEAALVVTHPWQEGEEVVLLVVDDVAGIALLSLLGAAQPHGAGLEVAHATASRPGAASARERGELKASPVPPKQ